MTDNMKTWLIVGGVAVAGYLAYKYVTGKGLGGKAPSSLVHQGPGQSSSAATVQGSTGSTDWWSTIGNIGKGLNSATSAVESTYNNIYDIFAGNSQATPATPAATATGSTP